MGSVIPNIEVPILYLSGLEMQTGHGALHSIIGALTIDVMLAVIAVYTVFPALVGLLERRFGTRWSHFAGVDVANIEGVPMVAYSALAGILMHIGIDYLTHLAMPYFWPFGTPVATMSIGRDLWWLAAVNGVLLVILAFLLIRYLGTAEHRKVETPG